MRRCAWRKQWLMGALQEGFTIAAQEMSRLGENASDPKLPKVEMHPSTVVDGDITTLTIRHQNQTRGMVIDLVLNKAALGKRAEGQTGLSHPDRATGSRCDSRNRA